VTVEIRSFAPPFDGVHAIDTQPFHNRSSIRALDFLTFPKRGDRMLTPSLMRCEYPPAGVMPFRVLPDYDDDDEADDDDDDDGPSLHRHEHWREPSDFGSPEWWFRA
jgi:hypothetical protein